MAVRRTRRGTTLIEVLVAIGVIAMLGGIMLTGLRGALDRRDSIACLSHIRTLGTLVAVYAVDNRDSFPSWADPRVNYESSPEHWPWFTLQGHRTMEDARWLDYTGFTTTTETLYCPANSQHPFWYEELAVPDYIISHSAYAAPEHFAPEVPPEVWLNRLGGRVQRMSMTRFPSSKAGMYEVFVWHGWRGVYGPGEDLGTQEYWQSAQPGSVWFIDGHARQMHQRDAIRPVRRYPVWPYATFGTTPWGMQGRDIQ
ncbi:MAG: type II secretion system GspH family protein [Phycisphaerales bacterium]|nr:type II secretion system protein [Planctomycetota bacterium]MCH8509861.1 type II secretion system GspH family protein [Phycisphaerales bacterium]